MSSLPAASAGEAAGSSWASRDRRVPLWHRSSSPHRRLTVVVLDAAANACAPSALGGSLGRPAIAPLAPARECAICSPIANVDHDDADSPARLARRWLAPPAYTTEKGRNDADTDRFRIKRVSVHGARRRPSRFSGRPGRARAYRRSGCACAGGSAGLSSFRVAPARSRAGRGRCCRAAPRGWAARQRPSLRC